MQIKILIIKKKLNIDLKKFQKHIQFYQIKRNLSLELNGNSTGKSFLDENKLNIIIDVEENNIVDQSNKIRSFSSLFKKNEIRLKYLTINSKDKQTLKENEITKEIGNSAKNLFLEVNKNEYSKYLNDMINDFRKAINSIPYLIIED